MRVLSYIHTFNDRDVIEQTIDAVRHQTRPPDAVLLVDNASTDGTLDRSFPAAVTVIRNPANLGTSGAIRVGFIYALEHGFDWMWILDADSVPDPETLATLLGAYEGWPESLQQETAFIGCLPLDQPEGRPRHARLFTRYGRAIVTPAPDQRCYPCHVTIWSGCLYRLAAVRRIGLPNPDYVLDRGELEYAYRVMKAGYKAFIHQDAVMRQNIRGQPIPKRVTGGPITLNFFTAPPIRCYYLCRNTLYFTLYDLNDGPWAKLRELFRVRSRPGRGPAQWDRLANHSVYTEFRAAAVQPRRPNPSLPARHLARIDRQHRGTLLGPMRVLAHIHTLNDAAVIEQLLEALRLQTRPPDAILIVDNGSTDATLDRTFPPTVTVIRNRENLGTSGTVRAGFAHGLEHGFDWVWIFDADSVPDPGALENLLVFFEHLAPAKQEQVCFLASRSQTAAGEIKEQPISLAGAAIKFVPIPSAEGSAECDCILWSGSLYRTAAVARIGLPSADYVLDVAELEYGYRARELGFTSYIVRNSVVRHDVGRIAGAAPRLYRFGPISVTFYEISPIRAYYSTRNMIYFLLYQYKPRRISRALHWVAWRVAPLTLNFVLRPRDYGRQILACYRGIWHGVTGNMAARY